MILRSPRFLSWSRDLFLFIVVLLAVNKSLKIAGYSDFDVYYDYGKKMVDVFWGTGQAHFGVDPVNTSPFRYAPIWGILFVPFALLPHEAARAVWVVIQWVFYERALGRTKEFFRLSYGQEWILLLGTLRFAWDCSSIGQISCLFAWLAIEAAIHFKDWKKGGPYLALAASIKLHPLVLLGIPLFKKRWTWVSAALGALAITLLASWLIHAQAFESYVALLRYSTHVLSPDTIGNQSFYGAFLRVGGENGPALFYSLLAVSAALCFQFWKKSAWDDAAAWMLGLAMLPLFGMLTWKNTYVLYLFPLGYLVRRMPKSTFALAAAFALLSQGVIGRDLNAISLHYGFLPWVAWIGMMAICGWIWLRPHPVLILNSTSGVATTGTTASTPTGT